MIDIARLREDPEAVRENIKKKFQDHKLPLVDEVIALDVENRKAQQEADAEDVYEEHSGLNGVHLLCLSPNRGRSFSRVLVL